MVQPPLSDADRKYCETLLSQGELDTFKSFAATALKSHDDPFLWSMLGKVAMLDMRIRDAIDANQNVVRLDPDNAAAHADLALLFIEISQLDAAQMQAGLAMKLDPNDALVLTAMGRVKDVLGETEQAQKYLQKALKKQPNQVMALAYLGDVYLALGRSEDAEKCYRKTIKYSPRNAEAYRVHSQFHHYTADDPLFAQLVELHQSLEGSDLQIQTGFALTKAFQDIGEYEVAFQFLSEANALTKKTRGYDFSKDKSLFMKVARTGPVFCDSRRVLAEADEMPDEPVPIFVIGMPRSGTSLAAQIISGHREVSNAGELHYVERLGIALAIGEETVTRDSLMRFRRAYLSKLQAYANGSRYVIDKMPQNFLFFPLMAAAFPSARFVHMKRDPAATCWSSYQRHFNGASLSYSCDLVDSRNYFVLYAALMESWKKILPGRIVDVSYEALTEAPEEEIPRLIEDLELSWDPACLTPEKNAAAMRTASAEQVRKPIYKGSSKAWERYAPMIAGRFDGLSELPR